MLNNNYCNILNAYFFKRIFIEESVSLKVFKTSHLKLLILTNKSAVIYSVIPLFFELKYVKNYLYFVLQNDIRYTYKQLYFFYSNILQQIKLINKPASITFLLKGVGFKISSLENSMLSFKLGYSHLLLLNLPRDVIIYIFKKKIILCSYNKMVLGNISNIIYNYRPANVFTGKGLLKKNSFFKLKHYVKKI